MMRIWSFRMQKRTFLLMAMVCALALAPACSDWIEENTSSGGAETSLTATSSGELDAETLKRIAGHYAGNAEATLSGKGIASDIKIKETVALTADVAEDGTVTISDGDQLNETIKLEGTSFVVTGTVESDSCTDVSITTEGTIADGQITGTISGSGKCGTGSLRVPVKISGSYLLVRDAARSLNPDALGITWTQVFDKVVVE